LDLFPVNQHDNNNHTRTVHPDYCTDRRSLHLNVMTAYKATPQQWQQIIDAVNISRNSPNVIITPETSCIFELRSRIEKLELAAGIHAAVVKEVKTMYSESLKKQALLAIDVAVADDRLSADAASIVRRALEQLDD